MEAKCSAFLRFITVVIAAVGAMSSFNSMILDPVNCAEFALFIVYIMAVTATITSWFCAFLSLKIIVYPVVPRSREVSDYLENIEESEKDKYITKCYVDTIEKLEPAINSKSKYLKLSYNSLLASVVLFLILSFSSLIYKGSSMSNNETESNSSKPDVVPEVLYVPPTTEYVEKSDKKVIETRDEK
jgi:hypothetical protein